VGLDVTPPSLKRWLDRSLYTHHPQIRGYVTVGRDLNPITRNHNLSELIYELTGCGVQELQCIELTRFPVIRLHLTPCRYKLSQGDRAAIWPWTLARSLREKG